MRARFVLAVGVTSFAGFAALGVACLADLPDPTSPPTTEAGVDTGSTVDAGVCPPPAQFAASSSCATALAQDQGFICPDDASASSVMGCFAGNRSCACVNGECPIVDGGCFSAACPPVVTADGGFPDAVCTPLYSYDVFYETDVPPNGKAYAPCYCTCEQCAVQCDGIGSIVASGSEFADSGPYIPISFDLKDHLPQQGGGRLGFYARLRVDAAGQGGAVFATFGTSSAAPRIEYLILFGGTQGVPLDGQFHDLVFYEGNSPDGGALTSDSWSSPSTGPQTLLLTSVTPQTIIEVDCVIPFFLPQ